MANIFGATPAVWYRLDEGALNSTTNTIYSTGGTVTSVGTNGNTSGNLGWATTGLAPVPTPGTTAALSLSGVNYLRTDYQGISGNNARTITAWIKPATAQTYANPTIVSWGPNTTGKRFDFRLVGAGSPNQIRVEISGASLNGTANVADGNWHHVAVTFPAGGTLGSIQLYVDGSLDATTVATGSSSTALNTTATNILIGNDVSDSTRYFSGLIDDVRIYTTNLALGDIQAIALAPGITNLLGNQVISYGNNAVLNAGVGELMASNTLSYQWYDNNTNAIAGGTSATLTLTNPVVVASGNYTAIVTNLYGSVTNVVSLTVSPVSGVGTTSAVWYRLDEGALNPSTNTIYSTGGTVSSVGTNGNTSGNLGWATTGLAPVPTPGTTAALSLSGTNYIRTDYQGVSGNNARTITAWINPAIAQSNSNPTIVSWGPASPNGQRFDLRLVGSNSPNQIRLEITGAAVNGTANVADGNWHHVAVTFPAGGTLGSIQLYVDGSLDTTTVATGSSSAAVNTTTTNVLIGYDLTGISRYFSGLIDDVRIYTTNLGLAAIQAIALAPGITNLPGNQVIFYGSNAVLNAGVGELVASNTLSYQWYDNNTNAIARGTNAILTLTNPAVAASGSYTAIVTNLYGTVTNLVPLVVNPASLTIAAKSDSRIYNGAAYSGGNGVTYNGFVNGETPGVLGGALNYSGTSQGAVNAGNYVITPSGLTSGNYNITYVSGTLTVGALEVTVTADSQSKVYGNGDPALTYEFSPALISGDSFSGALTRTAGENVGSYAINQGSLSLSANYNLSYVGANLGITPAGLSITANNDSKVYGQAKTYGAGSTNFTSSGLQNSETIGSVTITATSSPTNGTSATDNVGSYVLTPSAATAGTFNPANYSITYNNGTLSVIQASIFIGASSTKNPSGYTDSVSYIATLPTDATGSVVFSSTNGAFSTNAASSGSASSLSITNLPRGTNVITVAYLGDSNYVGSTNTLDQIVTNHPPVANVMTVTRTAGLALIIALSDVATNWSDVDGDPVELTGVTLQSTNGVNLSALNWSTNLDGSIVTTNGYAFIGYTNSPNVADQITYGINDGQGGTNLGYINIVIQGSVTGTNSITGHDFSSPYSNTVTAYGIPFFYYTLERSTNLTSPVWVDVSTNQAAANGAINAVDTFWDLGGVKPSPSAFYQLKWQP